MPVFFKTGKIAVKKYSHLCPDKFVYLKVGEYLLNLEDDKLIYLKDDSFEPIDMKEIGALPFYISLDVDFGRDNKIPLTLDRRGVFNRTDGVFAYSNIDTLFFCMTEREG